MSIIEKAAQRLEQLRKAGVEAPPDIADRPYDLAKADKVNHRDGAHGKVPAVSPVHLADAAEVAPESSATPTAAAPKSAEPVRRSKSVEIDLAGLATAGYITPEAQRSQVADEFRVLKRPIIKNAHGGAGSMVERSNCVMVTSALPSEGKSFVALNLAMSIASEVDSTVLLVDADVANPSLMRRMHLPAAEGLLDLLTNSTIELVDVMLRTNVEKLSLLPAGAAHRRATEMLASSGMADLVGADGVALPRSDPGFRFASVVGDDRGPHAGFAHGPDRHGRRS